MYFEYISDVPAVYFHNQSGDLWHPLIIQNLSRTEDVLSFSAKNFLERMSADLPSMSQYFNLDSEIFLIVPVSIIFRPSNVPTQLLP